MKPASKAIALIVVAVPVAFLGNCAYQEYSQHAAARDVCGEAKPGTRLATVLERASAYPRLKVRSGGPAGKNDSEWFDREYLRIGARLKLPGDGYSVVFAKPGVGYSACILHHKDGVIISGSIEERSN
jgi:hypothetical protein